MRSMHSKHDDSLTNPHRRALLGLTAATGAGLLAGNLIASAEAAPTASERDEAVRPQPDPIPAGEDTTADSIIEKLITWRVPYVFGLVGDGINSFIEALRKRQDRIRFIGVWHEGSAAFMATAYAKYTGRLGVCLPRPGRVPSI